MYKFIHNNTQFNIKASVYFCELGKLAENHRFRVVTYSDPACTIPTTNPISLDAYGRLETQVFTKVPHSYAIVKPGGIVHERSA